MVDAAGGAAGVAAGALYYLVPRATLNPLFSSGLAMLGWLLWLVAAGVSGLAVAVDTSVPYALTSIGIVAAMLMAAHAFIVVANLLMTLQGRWSSLLGVGTVAFASVSLAFLLSTALLEAVGPLRNVTGLVGGTEWQRGVFVYAAYGTGTFAMFALAHHALPRLLRREWGGGLLAQTQLWAAFGGATLAGLALIFAGLAEGSLRAQGTAPDAMAGQLLWFRLVALGGIGLLGLAALSLVIAMFVMYTMARPAAYSVPGQASTAAAGH